MDYSTPSFPVHLQHPEFAQTHVHHIGDTNQPSHPLVPPSPSDFSPSSIRVFSNESVVCIRCPKYEYSRLISFRMDWFDLFAGSKDSKESSPTPQFKSINSWMLSFLYAPTLTSTHNYWKNYSCDSLSLSLVAQSCPILWPHGLQPARLLCPWDSPGKNTGVGCHFIS